MSRGRQPKMKKSVLEHVRYLERETGTTGTLVRVGKHPIYEFGGVRVPVPWSPSCPRTRVQAVRQLRRKLEGRKE